MDTHIVLELALEGSSRWKEQVIAIQGHVVPQRVESGFYRANEDVRGARPEIVHVVVDDADVAAT